jgi:hypothetical protein
MLILEKLYEGFEEEKDCDNTHNLGIHPFGDRHRINGHNKTNAGGFAE